MSDAQQLVTLQDAAQHADVSVRTVQRWIERGHVTAHRKQVNPRHVRVDLAEIDAVTRSVAS